MHPNDKIVSSLNALHQACSERRRFGEKIILTSGCFDLVHPGHLEYLCRARELVPEKGPFKGCLVVGVNSDASVKRLKGPTRPVNSEANRAFVIAGFFPVELVAVFDDDLELINAVRPHIYVASATSKIRIYDDQPRVALLQSHGAVIIEVDSGKVDSTTAIIGRLAATG